ncbi:hypothetical protein [Cupriavidus necator]
MALGAAVGILLVLEAFRARVRASGAAISHALNVALFGGTAQFIVTGMIKLTGNPMSAVWYMAATCLLSFDAVVLIKDKRSEV